MPKKQPDALAIEYRPLDALIPYARNSRTHSDAQVAQIAASIREFGFTNPVLVDDQAGIIAGHGRVMAAQKLGLADVPTITLAGLSETQRRAYVIADNKLALNAGWDEDMLRVEIDALKGEDYDLSLLGFDAAELDKLMDEPNFEPASEDDQGKLDQLDPKWVACPHCGKEFDLRGQS